MKVTSKLRCNDFMGYLDSLTHEIFLKTSSRNLNNYPHKLFSSLFLFFQKKFKQMHHHPQFEHHHLKATSTLRKRAKGERERRDPHGFSYYKELE